MRIAAALLSLIALPLCAGIEFDPPLADAHTSVDIVVHGTSAGGGAPRLKNLEVSGHAIAVRMQSPSSGIDGPLTWRSVAHAGVLPAGIYEATVYYDDYRGESKTLIVRDDTVSPSRYVLPPSGGDVQFFVDAGNPVASVSIDGGAFLPAGPSRSVHVPPHAAGTVDVAVRTETGKVVTARALLTFIDPAAPPDLALYEPILFPVAFSGPGAFGTRWSTSNSILGQGTTRFRSPLPCSGCTDVLGFFESANLDPAGAAGQILYAERAGGEAELWLASRVRETTRGVFLPVPVFRERDLRYPPAVFLDVAHPPGSRTILRVWAFSGDGGPTLFADVTNGRRGASLTAIMTRPSPDGPYFAEVYLTSLIAAAEDGAVPLQVRARLDAYDRYDVRVWALLSVTDNATQQTTIFTPQ